MEKLGSTYMEPPLSGSYSEPAGPPDVGKAQRFYKGTLSFFLFFVIIFAVGAMVAAIIALSKEEWKVYSLVASVLGLTFLAVMTGFFWKAHAKNKVIIWGHN